MNSIKIDWLDNDTTVLKYVMEFNFDKSPCYIKYQDNEKIHNLYINLNAISCILVSPYMEDLEE